MAGNVLPPRIDLCNRELLASHLNAVVMSEIGLNGLDMSLLDIVDTTQDGIPLTAETVDQLKIPPQKFLAIRSQFHRIVADIAPLLQEKHGNWFNDEWIDQTLASISKNLNWSHGALATALSSGTSNLSRATQEIESGTYSLGSKEYKQAKRNQDQATRQLDLLKNDMKGAFNNFQNSIPIDIWRRKDFSRLQLHSTPTQVFIPVGDSGEYISRPRFIALREFGPETSSTTAVKNMKSVSWWCRMSKAI